MAPTATRVGWGGRFTLTRKTNHKTDSCDVTCHKKHKYETPETSFFRLSSDIELITSNMTKKWKRASKPATHSYNPLTQLPGYDGTICFTGNYEKHRGGNRITPYLMYQDYVCSRRRQITIAAEKKSKQFVETWCEKQRRSLARTSYYDAVLIPMRRYLAAMRRQRSR